MADTATSTAPVLTSEKLTELNKAYLVAWSEMLKYPDPMSKEAKDAKLAVWKIEGEIKQENVNLDNAAKAAKTAEMRNQRLKLNQTQLDALTALLAVKSDKKATPESVQTAQTAFDTAKEAVDNELLAKYAGSKSAKTATPSDNGTESKEASANKAAILELYAQGKTHKEIEEAGYKRSTVWHTINNFKKANAS